MHSATGGHWTQRWALCCLFTGHLLICVVSIQTGDIRTKTACAGKCGNKYSLECPPYQKIAIKDLNYYSKRSPGCNDTVCQDPEKCCQHDPSDCRSAFLESSAYDVYTQCSGMQQCGWMEAESIHFPCYNKNRTNYVRASYQCVDDNSFLDICSNESLESEKINLIFNGTHMETSNRPSNRCVCILSTSDCNSIAKLHFKTVDVRLHEAYNISKCHPHSKFTITDTNGPRDFRCQPNHFYRKFHDIYFSSSSYARVSMYYQPSVYPAQVWLQVKATMTGQKVVISCGKHSAESRRFCGPQEMIPTTPKVFNPSVTLGEEEDDIFHGNGAYTDMPSPTKNKEEDGAWSKEPSELPAIVGGAASAAIVLVLLILLICLLRRRQLRKRRKAKEQNEVSLRIMGGGSVPPPLPLNETYDGQEGNYYETVGATNGKLGESCGIVSPSKIMETFTPGRKPSGQFFPSDVKPPPPPPTPKIEKKPPIVEGNPYHMPWDTSVAMNRAKQRDLAYATSDEIQVLIQRMEHDRRRLNEGIKEEEQVVPNPNFYIHIDDYKIKQPARQSAIQEDESSDEEDKVGCSKYEDIQVDSDEDIPHRMFENPSKTKVNVLKESSNENCCESEDTGYRSVGSPEQVMVSEDDYLIPGSIKSSLSDGGKGGTLPKAEDNTDTDVRCSDVFEADKTQDQDEATTKF